MKRDERVGAGFVEVLGDRYGDDNDGCDFAATFWLRGHAPSFSLRNRRQGMGIRCERIGRADEGAWRWRDTQGVERDEPSRGAAERAMARHLLPLANERIAHAGGQAAALSQAIDRRERERDDLLAAMTAEERGRYDRLTVLIGEIAEHYRLLDAARLRAGLA